MDPLRGRCSEAASRGLEGRVLVGGDVRSGLGEIPLSICLVSRVTFVSFSPYAIYLTADFPILLQYLGSLFLH